jgi:hypothetical protein
MPYCIHPVRSNLRVTDRGRFLIFKKGAKKIKDINNRINETRLESKFVRLPLISPKEKAQTMETINK